MAEQGTDDFEWLLLLAFPNGGSTALAKLLLSAEGTIVLNPRVEGQWLVPAMCAEGARWDPDTKLDYREIRACWLGAARQAVTTMAPYSGRVLVVEKSPPNMCRYRAIAAMLSDMKSTVVVMTRDPYATCASWHIRNGLERIVRKWGWPGPFPVDEDAYFRGLGAIWMKRAEHLDSVRADGVHWLRYEDLVNRPSVAASRLADTLPRLRTMNLDTEMAVKDYPPQKIRNMNADRLSALTERQKAAIASALAANPSLVARLGYEVTPPLAGCKAAG